MNHGSLFSGIGGFDLASDWMGWGNKFHCEWNEFGQKILNYYWPKAESYGDITTTDFTIWNGKIDILTGGFPCQPYSQAGKRRGKEDERHLWPEMLRAIKEIKPRWIVGENVYGIVNWSDGMVFEEVQTQLEDEGYTVQPYILPAAAVNAPHRRDRVWFVAYSGLQRQAKRQKQTMGLEQLCEKRSSTNTKGQQSERLRFKQREISKQKKREFGGINCEMGNAGNAPNSQRSRPPRQEYREAQSGLYTQAGEGCRWENFPTQSPVHSGNDGLPTELDGITFPKWRNESIKGHGNAIVPQVAFQIFKAIEEYDRV